MVKKSVGRGLGMKIFNFLVKGLEFFLVVWVVSDKLKFIGYIG